MAGNGNKAGPTFSFPIMPVANLAASLSALDIEITPQKLAAPTPNEMKHVYKQLMINLLNIRPEELESAPDGALGVLSYPELYDEAIPEILFARALYVIPSTRNYSYI